MSFARKIRRNKAKELAKQTGLSVKEVWPYFRDWKPQAAAVPQAPAILDASGSIPEAQIYAEPAKLNAGKPGMWDKIKAFFKHSK